jgi:hypothetical protein
MRIDIDQLNLEELYQLNDRVIDRIKRLEAMKTQLDMMAFNLGARVSFDSKYGRQFGTLVKFNRKTVVVLTDEGREWRVSPHFLSPVKDVNDPQSVPENKKRLP